MINRVRKMRSDIQRVLREDYPQRKAQLEILPERIATERSRQTSIRSASTESMMIKGGGNARQERDIAAIVEIDRLKAEYNLAKREVAVIEKILATLTDTERRCIEQMDFNRQKGAVDRLSEELGYDRSVVYDIYNTALDKVYRLYWGR